MTGLLLWLLAGVIPGAAGMNPEPQQVMATCAECGKNVAVRFLAHGAFCEPCVTRCNEASDYNPSHECAVCATPTLAGDPGGAA